MFENMKQIYLYNIELTFANHKYSWKANAKLLMERLTQPLQRHMKSRSVLPRKAWCYTPKMPKHNTDLTLPSHQTHATPRRQADFVGSADRVGLSAPCPAMVRHWQRPMLPSIGWEQSFFKQQKKHNQKFLRKTTTKLHMEIVMQPLRDPYQV